MRRQGVRIALVVLLVAALGAAGYFTYTWRQAIDAEQRHAADVAGRVHTTALTVERLRAAQQAYVAVGQGTDFWLSRVDALMGQLSDAIGGLEHSATSEGARGAAASALTALADYQKIDARARGFVQQRQPLMASDLIFTDSLGAITQLADSVSRIAVEQDKAAAARVRALETNELYALSGSGAVALLVALLLAPVVRRQTPQDTRDALRALIENGAPAGAVPLRPEAPRVSPATGLPAREPQPPVVEAESAVVRPAAAVPTTPAAAPPQEPAPDLEATARICTDLGRVLDSSDLPALLARAAQLIDASGVIVWVADRAGAALHPAVAHGYSAALLARMQSIPRDADNAAAAAWRDSEEHIVAAQGQAPGALVTPILSAEGCVGVLAAETKNGAERKPATRALAAIVAAQLATLVTTLPATEQASD